LPAILILLCPHGIARAQDEVPTRPQGVVEAFRQGTPHLGFRYRYEHVDEDGIELAAHASTLRTVLSFRTAPLRGFELFIEAENVVELGNDEYRDGGRPPRGNGVVDRPLVADPAGTDINQVLLRYRGLHSDVRLGRQEINIADERFVGAVGWRQHHQTFNAINVSTEAIDRFNLQYVFSPDVYRVFGDKLDTRNHFLHAVADAGPVGTVRAYAILLEYTQPQFAGSSTDSLGFEVTGMVALGDELNAFYEFEYARQWDAADNPENIDADYFHLMGGGRLRGLTARAGWEVLGGSREQGRFNTPLATLHKFNGWADKFLVTPPDGLRDLYLQLGGTVLGLGWAAVLHDFGADSFALSYGTELDGQLTYRAGWNQLFALKAAFYDAEGFSTDTLKIWGWTEYTF
jgi:hypothetical protein